MGNYKAVIPNYLEMQDSEFRLAVRALNPAFPSSLGIKGHYVTLIHNDWQNGNFALIQHEE